MAITAEQIKAKYPGYVGWNDPNAIVADYLATGGQGKGNVPYALGGSPAPAPTVTSQPAPQPTSTGGGSDLEARLIQAMTQKGHTVETARAAIAGRGVADLAREYLGISPGGGLVGFGQQPTLDLPSLYKSLYESSGLAELEKQLSEKEKEYTEAKAKINENPFLSEATRVGKLAKIEQLFNERTANLRSDIARKKADIETQLQLQTKQFDINSAQVQQALNQFNALLSMGALANATGEDIANIARATGLSTSMIESAIRASKEIEPKMITTDTGFVLVNPKTGEILKTQTLPGKGGSSLETELLYKLLFAGGQNYSIEDWNKMGGGQQNYTWDEWNKFGTVQEPKPTSMKKGADILNLPYG